jgi:phosphoglycolate phosphatase
MDFLPGLLVLFDLDQTLVDAIPTYDKAFTLIFWEVFGVACSLRELDFGGKNTPTIFREGCAKKGVSREDCEKKLPLAVGEVAKAFMRFASRKGAAVRVLPGAQELLESLSRRKVLMGIITGSPSATAQVVLERSGLGRHFQFVVGGEEGKDKVENAVTAMKKAALILGKPPARVVLVGDSTREALTAKHHGFRFVGVATGFESRTDLESASAGKVFSDLRNAKAVAGEILS